MSSLFGNLNQQPGVTPASSIFSGSTLVGNSGNQQLAQQPASTGLFGAAPTTTTSSTTTIAQPGLSFGSSFQQAGAPAAAAVAATAASDASRPSLFGTSTVPTGQPQATANVTGLAPFVPSFSDLQPLGTGFDPTQQASAAAPATGAYFDSLLAKNKKQADGESALGELPSLQLGLGDLRQKLRKIGPRAQDRPLDGKAHYLLAASGVDPGAAVRDLGALGINGKTDGSQEWSAGELDVDAYLASIQTKTTLGMIADGLERSMRDFDSFLEDNITMEWEAQRKRIYQHFGIKPREDGDGRVVSGAPARESQGGFGRSRRTGNSSTAGPRSTARAGAFGRSGGMRKSVIGTPSRIGTHASEFSDVESGADASSSVAGVPTMDDRFRREKQGRLAEKIHALNDARQYGSTMCLCRDLAELEQKSGDRHAPHIVEAYRALMEMVGEGSDQEQTPRERQYAKLYLDPNVQSPNAIAMRKRILQGANRFMETQFFDEVNSLIAKHPTEANLGGKPDVVSKIKAYIRIRSARKTLKPDNTELQTVNGEHVWAVVFYLLRAGFVSEAAQYVNSNQNHFRSIDRTFSGYINSYASSEDRRLKRAMQERCTSEYNQRVRNAPEGSIDPFRLACYKIIGRCDVNNRSLDGLQTDVNDWIWLQFNLAREGDRSQELASETYGLSELQASIREIGLKHFPKTSAEDSNGSFGMFFYLQILSGMFEQAIAYLYPFSYVDAVHFAIALEYYGLLRPADAQSSANELLSHSTRGLPQINFGRMLGYYTRDFRAADVGAAVDYLVLICLNADEHGGVHHQNLCHTALRELVLETREFSKLIGDIKPNGQRITGLMEERGPLIGLGQNKDFIKQITLQAANYADDNGRTTDAVLLYHLAEDYDMVVSIVSRALSEAISLEMGEDPMRLMPVKPRVEGKEAEAQPGSSLSLAAIDDPVELARTMMSMYERDSMFRQKIRDPNRVACSVLLQMSEIKSLVEASRWPQAIDKIRALEILPLNARGDPTMIRNYAAKFAGLSQPVAINVPNLLMWTIICCTRQKEHLMNGTFVGNAAAARLMEDELKQISVDLTTYTSQLRYRFPPHLYEALARASAD